MNFLFSSFALREQHVDIVYVKVHANLPSNANKAIKRSVNINLLKIMIVFESPLNFTQLPTLCRQQFHDFFFCIATKPICPNCSR